MPAYELILLNNNRRSLRVFFWFLFFLQVTAAGAVIYFSTNEKEIESALSFAIIYLLFIILWFALRKTKYTLLNHNFVLQFVYLIFWLQHGGIFPAILCAAVLILAALLARKKSRVTVTAGAVKLFMGFSTRSYDWPAIDNLLLKDHLLTIDLENNHFFQAEIDPESYGVEEEGFNRFCKEYLGED